MKPRKTKELYNTLLRKGFYEDSNKKRHKFLILMVNGKKVNVKTFFSHGNKEYSSSLMSKIKNQLKFETSDQAEDFFDCPMSQEEYIRMLRKNGSV